jgi:hypothetical protein
VEERPKYKRKRAPGVLAIYEVVQRWVTGDKATQPEEDIEQEIFDNALDAPIRTGKTPLSQSSGYQSLSVEKGWHTYIALCKLCSVLMSNEPSLQV